MQFIHAAIIFAVACCITLSSADALEGSGRVFPPDNCSASTPFLAFNGAKDSNTYCSTGQDVLHNALPFCTDGQQVVKEGSQFSCKSVPTLPACATDQLLTFDGAAYSCVQAGATPCSGSNCANSSQLALPACGADEMLTSDGSKLICVKSSGGMRLVTLDTPISIPGEGWVDFSEYVPAGAKFVVVQGSAGNTWSKDFNDEKIQIGGVTMCAKRATGGWNYLTCTGIFEAKRYLVQVLASNDYDGWFATPHGGLQIVGYGE